MERVIEFLKKYKLYLCIAGAVLIAGSAIMLLLSLWNPEHKEVQAGTKYLEKLESKDITTVEEQVKEVQKQARMEAIQAGELPLWAQFSDSLIFGDSRSVGLYVYEFLDTQRVIAEAGYTLKDIAAYEDQIVSLNPSNIFLCTGINDVSIGYWPTPEDYVAGYQEVRDRLQSLLPNTTIYINSIFPAQDPAFEKSSKWREIPDYNAAVKAWCEENGYPYIDNTQVYEEHNDLYEIDGIHFQRDFYEYWAVNMLAEVDE